MIIDEEKGRSYARNFDLTLTGTLGILLRAKQNGLINEVKPLMELLIARDVWISKRVFDHVLVLAGEKS